MPTYTTPAQAAADAARLAVASHIDVVPVGELTALETLVLDCRTDSDTLLFVAEELEKFAAPVAEKPLGRAMRQLAKTLAEIAPTRANPLQPKAE